MDDELNVEEQARVDQHVADFKNEQLYPDPVSFSVRHYIRTLEKKLAELEGTKGRAKRSEVKAE